MSGIAGIVNLDGAPVDQALLRRMTDFLAFRGPDAQEVWCDGSVGFGHATLRTTFEAERERQPCSLDGEVWLTADARVDARDDLKRELEAAGRRDVKDATDADLILHAYHAWGERCVEHLLGDFAFAIWDGPKRRLFCARDHLGVKPLVYYHSDKFFAFASQAKGLLTLRPISKRLNEGRIADYLVDELEGVDHTSTFYVAIQRLAPAHSLAVDGTRSVPRRYWCLDPDEEIRYPREGQYAERFEELFTEAVQCRLRGPSPHGSMLSGGIDSGAIVGVGRRLLRERGHGPLVVLSAVSADETNCIESRNISAVVSQGHVEPLAIRPYQLRPFLKDYERVTLASDDLFDNLIHHVPLTMYCLARQRGLRGLLDGIDGDLVASHGLEYLDYLLRTWRFPTFVREAAGSSRFSPGTDGTPGRLLCRKAVSAIGQHVPKSIRGLRRRLAPKPDVQSHPGSLIRREFADRIDLEARLATLRAHISSADATTPRRRQAASLRHPYVGAALERYDRVAAAFSIEPRHPFFDKRLVQYCLALPWQHKVHDGWTKIAVRRAFSNVLPQEVVWRRGNDHLGPEFARSWHSLERELIAATLRNSARVLEPYIDIARLSVYHQAFIAGSALAEEQRSIWKAVTLAHWLQRDNGEPAPV